MSNTAYSTRPRTYVIEHARALLTSPRHRAKVDTWLHTLALADADELLNDIGDRRRSRRPSGSQRSESTALLLRAHQDGDQLATAVLLGGKIGMLCAVARYAHAPSFEERLHLTIEAFLERALAKVCPDHEYVDGQLYFVTMRTVTVTARKMGAVTHAEIPVGAGGSHQAAASTSVDANADMESYLSASGLLDWALQRGVINNFDHRALQLCFTGSTAVPVREAAARLGVGEDALESRLRRARGRLKEAARAHRDDIERACVSARFAQHSPVAVQSRVAA